MSSDVGDLGRRVRERRTELAMSIEDLADKAGMDPVYLRTLETRPSPQLSQTTLWRLAAALNMTLGRITGSGTQAPPGPNGQPEQPILDSLDRADCLDLISAGGVGRIVFSQPRGPVALPVNFRVLDGDVVFRTATLGTLGDLPSILALGPVSFEVDHIDDPLMEGWSVLISGQGHAIVDASELERARATAVTPWTGGDRDIYIRIKTDEVTGRRIRFS